MHASTRAWLQIHFCVVLWGFTAVIGKTITLAALPLVWQRMIIVTAALLPLPGFWRGLFALSSRLAATYLGIGVLVTLHWITFYSSIKLSNASVAATCMALAPVLIAFIDPLIGGRRFDPRELLFGLAVIPGVALVVGGTPAGMRVGIAVGALSAFFAACFSSLNKSFVMRGSALAVTGLEMASGVAFLPVFAPLLPVRETLFVLPNRQDTLLLLTLAIGCTLLPFALSLVALRHLSAFSAALAVNMEPVYAILLAIVLLGEQRELTPAFYTGVAIILAVVFTHRRAASG